MSVPQRGALTLAVRGRRGGLVLLVLVAAIDFSLYTLGSPQGSIIWRKWEQSASSSQKLPRYEEYLAQWPGPPSHKGRLYDDRCEGWIPVSNQHCLNGYRAVTGYAGGLQPIQRLDYHHINSLRTAEVAWCWHPQALSASLIGLGPPLNGGWRSVPKPLPRARMVSKAVVSDAPGEDLKKIDVDSMALVSRPVALPPSAPGTADLIEDRPGKITIAVAAPRRQLLVVSESYHHGWQARVDSQPAPLSASTEIFSVASWNAESIRWSWYSLRHTCGRGA